MSDAKAPDLEHQIKVKRFNGLYSDWLNVRAASEDPRLPQDDESAIERDNRRDGAARALLSEPFLPWMIWRKWEVLESFLEVESFDDGWSDRRVVMALGCLKADLSALGIGGG